MTSDDSKLHLAEVLVQAFHCPTNSSCCPLRSSISTDSPRCSRTAPISLGQLSVVAAEESFGKNIYEQGPMEERIKYPAISPQFHLNIWNGEWIIRPFKNHMVIPRRIFVRQARLTFRKYPTMSSHQIKTMKNIFQCQTDKWRFWEEFGLDRG